MRITEQM